MKKQVFNPFLPCYEYVADGEPHVFGDRLYLFGSHDAFNGEQFCQNDYVCWSTPLNDLSAWVSHGVIYSKNQDPMNNGSRVLYAPDVTQGPDGRYYLYYTLDFISAISVAVAERPEGPYTYYGVVRDSDGHILGQRDGDVFQYDPGLLKDDDGSIHLYSGVACENSPLEEWLGNIPRIKNAAYHYRLSSDMLSVIGSGDPIIPGSAQSSGTDFEGHAFFEASSIRKIGSTYFFVYSSIQSHELCYATAVRPEGPFAYRGVLISLGDIGLDGRRKDCEANNFLGTNHGSIEQVNGQWYVFYHRQTNDNQLSRQACAEKIHISEDGTISQAETTSCGLNDGFLCGRGTFEARIACNLSGKDGPVRYAPFRAAPTGQPFFTQDEPDNAFHSVQYIKNMTDGSWVSFKYFLMEETKLISLRYRGTAKGNLFVSTGEKEEAFAVIPILPGKEWHSGSVAFEALNGKQALFFRFAGTGALDLLDFSLG